MEAERAVAAVRRTTSANMPVMVAAILEDWAVVVREASLLNGSSCSCLCCVFVYTADLPESVAVPVPVRLLFSCT